MACAHGITLSREPHDFARQRIVGDGLPDMVNVELRDYQGLQGEALYDKVSSIGMFEHVGLAGRWDRCAEIERSSGFSDLMDRLAGFGEGVNVGKGGLGDGPQRLFCEEALMPCDQHVGEGEQAFEQVITDHLV